jgi:hypothetical protein
VTGTPVLVKSVEKALISVTELAPVPRDAIDANGYNEATLQEIVDSAPRVLGVRQFLPTARTAVSLGREIPLDLGGKQGFIDNLLATDSGHLVLVETKLWRNPQALREVVAQVLHYGSALMSLLLENLEDAIRRQCSNSPNRLGPSESISDRVMKHAEGGVGAAAFEDRLERQLRAGEILFLVVGDGVHQSVERLAGWLGELKALPFSIGLIELPLFRLPTSELLVVPRTLLRTKEVARHVVVVNVTNETSGRIETVLKEELTLETGGTKTSATRLPVQPRISEEGLIAASAKLNSDGAVVLTTLLRLLREAAFDIRETAKWIQFGLNDPEGGPFLGMIGLGEANMYAQQAVRLFDLVGADAVAEHRKRLNLIGHFYTPEGESDPKRGGAGWLMPRYEELAGREQALVDELARFRDFARSKLESQSP